MEFKDYYKIMGVEETASGDDIKKAYRRLAKKFHPDVSKETDAEARFKDVGEAYEVLKDPEKRTEYDQLRKYGFRGGTEFTPPPGWRGGAFDMGGGAFDMGGGASGFSDFFEALFGAGRPAGGTGGFGGFGGQAGGFQGFASRGQDLRYHLSVSLQDAYSGATQNIHLQVPEMDAQGRQVTRSRNLKVTIPAGVTDGKQIRLRGQGGPGVGGGGNGDLYLEIDLESHPLFRVDGKNVILTLPLAPWEAAFGGSIKVPTLGGAVSLKIPENAQSGQKLRLKGRGLPGPTPGDQIIELQIQMPPVHDEEQRALLEKMAETMAFDPRAHFGV